MTETALQPDVTPLQTGKLNKLSGAQFDRQFAQDLVKDHKEAISTFEKEAKSKGRFAC